jgi:hypothetical protein
MAGPVGVTSGIATNGLLGMGMKRFRLIGEYIMMV